MAKNITKRFWYFGRKSKQRQSHDKKVAAEKRKRDKEQTQKKKDKEESKEKPDYSEWRGNLLRESKTR